MITQKLVKEMGGDISFHSQPNRGSTFWFHINLDLNPNVQTDGPVTDCLKGMRLAYVEPNAAAAQCTLDVLSSTPLEVVYSPTFSALANVYRRTDHAAGTAGKGGLNDGLPAAGSAVPRPNQRRRA